MTLHPDALAFLAELAKAEGKTWPEMTPEESREIFSSFTDLFGTGPEMASVQNLTTPQGVRLRCYRDADTVALPAMVYFHGGGWVLGNLDTHDALCRHLANASGRAIIAVDYRLAPENPFPAAWEDAVSATQFVIESAQELGVDPQHIAVGGDSAGGNLAAAAAIQMRKLGLELDCQVLIYPVVEPDFTSESYSRFATDYMLTRETMQWFWQQYVPGPSENEVGRVRLLDAELTGLPPTKLLTAEYDVLRSEGEAFGERLQAAGVDVDAVRYPGMLHGFVHFNGLFSQGLEAVKEIGEYLRSRA